MPILYILSGAGLSADSGISTFREDGGRWSHFDMDEVCNYYTWKRNREKVFDFYRQRQEECCEALPNGAHLILAQWQRRWGKDRVKLLTQNVDLLLEKAGALEVTHLHGRLDLLLCTACGRHFEIGDQYYDASMRCPHCNSLKGTKPGVIFFHEPAPQYKEVFHMRKVLGNNPLVVIGTSLEVLDPLSFIPIFSFGKPNLYQINPNPQSQDAFGHNIAEKAFEGLKLIEAQIEGLMGPALF